MLNARRNHYSNRSFHSVSRATFPSIFPVYLKLQLYPFWYFPIERFHFFICDCVCYRTSLLVFFRVVVNIFVFRIGFLIQNKSKFRSNQQTKKCNAALFLQSLFPVSTRCVEPLFLFVFMFPIWNSRTKPVMSQKPRCTTLKQKQNANLIGLCTCRC